MECEGVIMKRRIKEFVIAIIGLGLLMTIPGCFPVVVEDEPWAPDGHWGRNEYYYYPGQVCISTSIETYTITMMAVVGRNRILRLRT